MVKHIAILVFSLLLVAACSDYHSAPRFEGEVYSVAGLLISGHSIDLEHPLYITKSANISEFDPLNLFVTEAELKIFELDTGKSWELEHVIDFSQMRVKWIDPQRNIIQPGYRYRMELRIPRLTEIISAETTVPPPAELNPDYYGNGSAGANPTLDEASMGEVAFKDADYRFPIALNTFDKAGTFNFIAEIYCLEEFSTNLEFTTPVMGITHAPAEMESGYYASGESMRRIMIQARFASAFSAEHDSNYLLLRDYRQAYIFFGRYRVSAYLCDQNYYRYKYMPEGYLHGGIKNGLGYFGSASGGAMYVRIVKGEEEE
ncbi:MAG: DUF4249 family protein [Candidatus Cloacimonetes bacterium]|nr:DUF4249 family protein [Candidatus Cloacimonadota bacterium]